jgi:hypothetical protein
MVGVQRPAVQSPVHHLDQYSAHLSSSAYPIAGVGTNAATCIILLGHMCCKHGLVSLAIGTWREEHQVVVSQMNYDDQCLLCCSSSMTLCTAKG